jgi:membrane-associated phospholipid phosphatase
VRRAYAAVAPPRRAMFARQRHALAFGIGLLALGFALTIVVAVDPADPLVQGIDDRWLEWMVDLRTPFLVDLATAVSWLGGPLVTFPLRVLVTVALALRRRWLQFGAWVGAIVCSELCIGPLKDLVGRPRPPAPLIHTSSPSYPSGHAIAASVTALGLVIVLAPPLPKRARWTAVAAGFAALMALSRTVLSAHWLTDVIGGVLLGVGFALVWPAALELIRGAHRAPRVMDDDVAMNE